VQPRGLEECLPLRRCGRCLVRLRRPPRTTPTRVRQRHVRTQLRTSDEARPTARHVLRDKSHLRRAAIPLRRAAEATRPARTAAARTATLVTDIAHLPLADHRTADRTAEDAAIRRLRRIALDRSLAITVAADRTRVPAVPTAARAADTRVRTEATDAKPDLISYQRRPAIRAAFLFHSRRDVASYVSTVVRMCILPDSA
jgi:hypothetical protein